MNCDFLVEAGGVLTMDAEWHLYEPGFIAVSGSRIAAVGPASEEAPWRAAMRQSGGRMLGGPDALAMPGFVNTHTHVPMAAFRGACEDMEDRLTRFLFPMEARLVEPDLVRKASAFCMAEMLKSGTTCFADMYYYEDEVAKAAKAMGLRCLLGETVVNFAAPDAAEPYGGIANAERFIGEWKGDALVSPCYAPHAPYTVEADALKNIWEGASRADTKVLMHVAESDKENARFRASNGSVIKYLESIGCLDERLVAAHAIYVDDDDIALIKKSGAGIAHCPASNAKSGRPVAPAYKYSAAGIPLGLATDGPVSGNGMDMQSIVSLYPKLQKLLSGSRSAVSSREALRAATVGGAEVLGLAGITGSLEKGKRADIAVINTDDFSAAPVYDWYATAVYAMKPHNVASVLVDGRLLVDGGRLQCADETALRQDMRGIAARCRSEIAKLNEEYRAGKI